MKKIILSTCILLFLAFSFSFSHTVKASGDISIGEERSSQLPTELWTDQASTPLWEYAYTAEPYVFYRNTINGHLNMVQMTPTWQHTQNVMLRGWMESIGGAGGYLKTP